MTEKRQTQLDKFEQTARGFEIDDDLERFAERRRELAKHKPAEKLDG